MKERTNFLLKGIRRVSISIAWKMFLYRKTIPVRIIGTKINKEKGNE